MGFFCPPLAPPDFEHAGLGAGASAPGWEARAWIVAELSQNLNVCMI